MPSQLAPPKRGRGTKASPPDSGGQLFSGGPKASVLTSTASLLLLFAISSSGKQHALNAITHLAAPGLQYGPRVNAGPASVKPATSPSSSTKNTPLVRPALRNQSSSTFFSERAAQGHEAASPCWLGKRDWKGNLRYLKMVLKCNKNVLKPLKSIAVRGVCKASNFQLLQGTFKTNPATTR